MISVLIINYRTYELTKNTLNSLLHYTSGVEYEIILLDNYSLDGSIEKLEEDFNIYIQKKIIHIIKNPKNGGFAYAINIGIKYALGDTIVLVNSDILIQSNILKCVDSRMKSEAFNVIMGPKIILPSGAFEHGSKRGFPTPLNSIMYFLKLDKKIKFSNHVSYRMHEVGEDSDSEVDAVSGSFMAISKKIVQDIGGLDEAYFMYGEDIDWCYRAKQKGYKVLYLSSLGTVIHYHSQSMSKNRQKVQWAFYQSMIIYNEKHNKNQNIILKLIVNLGIRLMYALNACKSFIRGLK